MSPRDGVPSDIPDLEVRNCAVCADVVGYWRGLEFVKLDPDAATPRESRGWRCGTHRVEEAQR